MARVCGVCGGQKNLWVSCTECVNGFIDETLSPQLELLDDGDDQSEDAPRISENNNRPKLNLV